MLDTIVEALDQVTLFVDGPADGSVFASGWVRLDGGLSPQIFGDGLAQVVPIISSLTNDTAQALQTFKSASELAGYCPPLP